MALSFKAFQPTGIELRSYELSAMSLNSDT
jgi:hypothetical protein